MEDLSATAAQASGFAELRFNPNHDAAGKFSSSSSSSSPAAKAHPATHPGSPLPAPKLGQHLTAKQQHEKTQLLEQAKDDRQQAAQLTAQLKAAEAQLAAKSKPTVHHTGKKAAVKQQRAKSLAHATTASRKTSTTTVAALQNQIGTLRAQITQLDQAAARLEAQAKHI